MSAAGGAPGNASLEAAPAPAVSTPPSPRSALLVTGVPALFVLLWSTGFIGAKFGLPYAGPMTFLALRMGLVMLLLGIVCIVSAAPWPASPRRAAHIAVAGLLVHGAYLGGVFGAIHLGMSAGLVAVMVGLQPLLTVPLARRALGERITRQQGLGLLLGFIGVTLVLWQKISFRGIDALALTLAAVALLGITVGTLYQKRWCTGMDLRTGGVIQYAVAFVLFAVLALALEDLHVVWTGRFVFALAWLVLVLSLGAVGLLYRMIRLGAATRVASLFYLVPPTTATIAYLMFDERLSAIQLAGMASAAVGVALALRTPAR